MTTSRAWPETVPELSIVFPAFNEEASIGSLIERTTVHLDDRGIDFEIDVVDDGSSDSTFAVLEKHQRIDSRLRVVRHRRNLGYGAALRSGFAQARGRRILLSDSDGQFSIEELDSLWSRRNQADLVLGYRNPRKDPWRRRAAGWIYRQIVRVALGVRFRDVNCGFKLIDRRVVEDMKLTSRGALISAELLTRARLAGATFVEVAVEHLPRRCGRATGLLPGVVLRTFFELLSLRAGILAHRAGVQARGLRAECNALESETP